MLENINPTNYYTCMGNCITYKLKVEFLTWLRIIGYNLINL